MAGSSGSSMRSNAPHGRFMSEEPNSEGVIGATSGSGDSDGRIPEIGIGTYDVEPDACTNAVTTALEYGYRHVDTAEMYENQRAVGRALERADVDREEVFVATKVYSANLAYDDVIDHAQKSAELLGVDVIDLLYVHWPIRTYEADSTLAAFDELYDRGAIRHVGLSNFTADLLDEALGVLDAPLFAHQVECHPLCQQDRLRRYAREHGHYLVAYSPLAKGAVTEVPELVSIAKKYDATPAQISLAWLQAKSGVVPIPKSATPAHIRENYDALAIELDEKDIEHIDGIERTERMVDIPDAPWNA